MTRKNPSDEASGKVPVYSAVPLNFKEVVANSLETISKRPSSSNDRN